MKGFGSNKSCCEGPPAMKRKMTRFALGIMPEMRAASGFDAARTMSCSASAPKPQAVRWSHWRRVRWSGVFMVWMRLA